MTTPARLLVFALGAVGVFLLAFGLGRLVNPSTETDDHEQHDTEAGSSSYSLEVLAEPAAESAELAFRVLDADGEPVTAFEERHERELHLIAVNKESLLSYQHLHPAMAADGTWSVDFAGTPGGTWRLYADTQPAGVEEQVLTADLKVPGAGPEETELPAPSPVAEVDGFTVELAEVDGMLMFTVERDGRPAVLQPYLGAAGHLVAIEADDLDYLHTHPMEGLEQPVGFHLEFPEPGDYVLHLDFQVDGEVHTASFVHRVYAQASQAPETEGHDADEGGEGHDEH